MYLDGRFYLKFLLIFIFTGFLPTVCPAQTQTGVVPKTKHRAHSTTNDLNDGIYENSQFAFSVKIPPELSPVPSVDGAFTNIDSQVRLKVWGQYNETGKTLKEEYEDSIDRYTQTEITYKTIGKNFFVLSGYHEGNIFYWKEISVTKGEEGIFVGLQMMFPKEQKAAWDPILTQTVKTFRPIPGKKFVSQKDLYSEYEIKPNGFRKLPGMEFQVDIQGQTAIVSWEAHRDAIGYELSISSAYPDKHELIKQMNLGKKITEARITDLEEGKNYEFTMCPLYRTGKGPDCFQSKQIPNKPGYKFPNVTQFDIQSLKGWIKLSWDKVPEAASYEVYESKDGQCYTNMTKYGTQMNAIGFSGLTDGVTYFYAVVARPRDVFAPTSDWAVAEAIPGMGMTLHVEPTVIPETPICPTPYPDSTNYEIFKTLPLTQAREGYDGKLILWVGKELNSNWKTGNPDTYKWVHSNPMIQLVDAAGQEQARQYFEYKDSLVDLVEVAPIKNAPPVYLISSSNEGKPEEKVAIGLILYIENGKLEYLEAKKINANIPNPTQIFLEKGNMRTEAGNWKWAPSKIIGNQDILTWTTSAPRGSIMHPDEDLTPTTEYRRYHFNGEKWICYMKTESGFVGFKDMIFPDPLWFPAEDFFPKVP